MVTALNCNPPPIFSIASLLGQLSGLNIYISVVLCLYPFLDALYPVIVFWRVEGITKKHLGICLS